MCATRYESGAVRRDVNHRRCASRGHESIFGRRADQTSQRQNRQRGRQEHEDVVRTERAQGQRNREKDDQDIQSIAE